MVHGLAILAAGRGKILNSQGTTLNAVLHYSLDTQWLSLGLRGRYTQTQFDAGELAPLSLANRSREVGIGLTGQYFVDPPGGS